MDTRNRTTRYPKPANWQPNPRKPVEQQILDRARSARSKIEGKTLRQLLIDRGVITPKSGR